MSDKQRDEKYNLSFTSIGVRRLETVEVARAYVEQPDWGEVRRRIVGDNIVGRNKESTRKRIGGEIIKRLKSLNDEEIHFLTEALDDDQLAMLWVAVCRTYPILRSFSQDVVSARFADLIPDVPRTAWSAFLEEETIAHPEIGKLTEKSLKQLETRTFGMLKECRLVDVNGNITPLYPSGSFVTLLASHSPQDLDLFPKVGALI